MAASPNVELEAAKFLHKLIQESTDEPTKLATKLYVILQHMRSSGKENSMPYQVISRAMETVINQHDLDIEALMSSRVPSNTGVQAGNTGVQAGNTGVQAGNTGVQAGNTSSPQLTGSSQTFPSGRDHEVGMSEKDLVDLHPSSRSSVVRSSVGHDSRQGSLSHISNKSFEHESPSSFETRSANSQSQERRDVTRNDSKKAKGKRKRGTSSSTVEPHIDNPGERTSKGKLANQVEATGNLPFLVGEHGQFNKANDSTQVDHSLKTTYNSNLMSRVPSIKYPAVEASSVQGLQHASSGPTTTDAFNFRNPWKSAGNVTGSATGAHRYVEPGISNPMHFTSASYNNPGPAKMKLDRNMEASSITTPSVDPSAAKSAADSEYWKHGDPRVSSSAVHSRTGVGQFISSSYGELASSTLFAGKPMEQDGAISNAYINNNKQLIQGGMPGNNMETNMIRGAPSRDTGKSPITQTHASSGMPFKEQHLKQLRAQCLVFLAFRNNMLPKKLHLEIAMGDFQSKEDEPRKELMYIKGEEQSMSESNCTPVGNFPSRLSITRESETALPTSSSSEIGPQVNLAKAVDPVENKDGLPSNHSLHAEERTLHSYSARGREAEIPESRMSLAMDPKPDSLKGMQGSNLNRDGESWRQSGNPNHAFSLMSTSKQMRSDTVNWKVQGDTVKACGPSSLNLLESAIDGKNNASQQNQSLGDHDIQGMRYPDNYLARDQWKPILGRETENHAVGLTGTNLLAKNMLESSNFLPGDDVERNVGPLGPVVTFQYEEDNSDGGDLPPSPKYTTSEKWIMDQQKRRALVEQTWRLKQQKTEQKIGACFEKLKENVSSSEDISAKTRSVIELKKLKLLEIQRRLRSDILSDYFRPIATEMDRLKSIKKNRLGRRPKQIERFEQKMKEERQRRTRDRQKEFFSEIEVHKERLDDVFKMKRERWKGFNRYAREFHKRKERVHREKIDRIQREKINLLKINDVEGYLRMVQDAKSDRVKQLLKETEKYLQKLGSKLQEAKATARHSETDIDDSYVSNIFENNDVENEDEADQAKHYMESNEKYYLMAHTVKETIAEQPTSLEGGKLREYQLNGLRWLVSLYNNHLNGILADEMGLGKTVQVISLICYLMETKNDRGPFLVVVPSSVLPGWVSEISFWAPSINKIVYSGPPEERRRLFKERIVHLKFNVLLTTYEYLMNKHDRPKLSKVDWHYIIIDEGHRIKNASCKLNADLKQYRSAHRLLLTGTPLQNNLEELWALLNFLLPNIFNASCDFSQWFNKPFESNGDNSPDEALLSEEENLLIINRLHQVLRPFVLRRLKHKVENELPEKIERLVRCEASSYQKLLMKRVDENLGAIGTSKARTIHNSVMELRNICNHPYLSQLHVEEVHDYVPKHYLPNVVRLCGKLEMLDRILPKLKATDHRVLFFSTMTRLLDIMEDYLWVKQYRYLRLDGHTAGGDRGGLIDQFNQPNSPFFIFLLSIRAGGVGVNLQAADTVIIFDTDWNPQVDLQAQARAHRIGQKKDVLVLRLETVHSVEEQVRAAAEHKLGVANQSITAGFFDNNTSAEDRREYLEALLRESKTEEATPVLDDDALNYLIARSESEIDVFESVDKQRKEEELVKWENMMVEQGKKACDLPPSRILTDDDIRPFYEAMSISEVSAPRAASTSGSKRKRGQGGGLDTQHYGRGKRAREVRNYEEQWTEEEFEKLCKADSPDSPKPKEEVEKILPVLAGELITDSIQLEPTDATQLEPTDATQLEATDPSMLSPNVPTGTPTQPNKDIIPPTSVTPSLNLTPIPTVTPPAKRGRGRPKRVKVDISFTAAVPIPSGVSTTNLTPQSAPVPVNPIAPAASSSQALSPLPAVVSPTQPVLENVNTVAATPRRRGRKPASVAQTQLPSAPTIKSELGTERETLLNSPIASSHDTPPGFTPVKALPAIPVLPASFGDKKELEANPVDSTPATSVANSITVTVHNQVVSVLPSAQDVSPSLPSSSVSQSVVIEPGVNKQPAGRGRGSQSSVEVQVPRRRGRRSATIEPVSDQVVGQIPQLNEQQTKGRGRGGKAISTRRKRELEALEVMNNTTGQEVGSTEVLDVPSKRKKQKNVSSTGENVDKFSGEPHKDEIVGKTLENADTALEKTPASMDNEIGSGNSAIAVELEKPEVLVSCGRQDQSSRMVEKSDNSSDKREKEFPTSEGTDKHAHKYGIEITEVDGLRVEHTHEKVVISNPKTINNQNSDTKSLDLSTESRKVSSTLEVKNDVEVQSSELCSDELGEQKINKVIQQQNSLSTNVNDGNGADKVGATTQSVLNSVKFPEGVDNQCIDKISDDKDKIQEGDSTSNLPTKSPTLIEKAHESECGGSVSRSEISDKQSLVAEVPAAMKLLASDLPMINISSELALEVETTERSADVSIDAAPLEAFPPEIEKVDGQESDSDGSVIEKVFVSASEGDDKQIPVIAEPETLVVSASDSILTDVVPGQTLDVSTDADHISAGLKNSPPENKLQKGECTSDHSEKFETTTEKLNGGGSDDSFPGKALILEASATIEMPGSDLKESNVIEEQATEDITTNDLNPYKQMENTHGQGLDEKPLSESETKMAASGVDPTVTDGSMNKDNVSATEDVRSLDPKGSQMEITNPMAESGIQTEVVVGDSIPGNSLASETEISCFKVETSIDMADHSSGGDDKTSILVNNETRSTDEPLKSPDNDDIVTENMDMDTTANCVFETENSHDDIVTCTGTPENSTKMDAEENENNSSDELMRSDTRVLGENASSETDNTENTNLEMSIMGNAKADSLIDQEKPNVPAENNLGNISSSGDDFAVSSDATENQAGNNDSSAGQLNELNMEEEEAHLSKKETVDVQISESLDTVMIDVQPPSEAQLMDDLANPDPKQPDSSDQTHFQSENEVVPLETTPVSPEREGDSITECTSPKPDDKIHDSVAVTRESEIQEFDAAVETTSISVMPIINDGLTLEVGESPSQGLQILLTAEEEAPEADAALSQLPETKVETGDSASKDDTIQKAEEKAAVEETRLGRSDIILKEDEAGDSASKDDTIQKAEEEAAVEETRLGRSDIILKEDDAIVVKGGQIILKEDEAGDSASKDDTIQKAEEEAAVEETRLGRSDIILKEDDAIVVKGGQIILKEDEAGDSASKDDTIQKAEEEEAVEETRLGRSDIILKEEDAIVVKGGQFISVLETIKCLRSKSTSSGLDYPYPY
ncbi:chromatin structure-remodeling complex protein SYD [Impatiens glandulifera]|uniref:chromatin structure-remodeling complex protein SYD n=1 Tax=Impatiens glandulifera TaxID=253017 RepID=UPI001FB19590|nr:chromatin structure-remodeling complex protein SYD [Impatiens glandulifera]XP_047321945.1 chromatin structure-remodeling complex protein SYD [Impatiens glandulifera]